MKIGILGGGQLGQMLALAGYPLGLRFVFLDPHPDCPASRLAPVITGSFTDERLVQSLAHQVDVVTYEFENIPFTAVEKLSAIRPVFPPPRALQIGQDRLEEKKFFQKHRLPTPEFRPVETWDELTQAEQAMGLPLVLKTRRLGYDGKGQAVLRHPRDLHPAWERLKATPLIVERFQNFDREVSQIAVRDALGTIRFYPLVQNHHHEGILRWSQAPAPRCRELTAQAQKYARRLLEDLQYVGVLTIEFFVQKGKLLANEIAPRVHNSGHWTIEGALCSQFENHLRAIAGLPLGSPEAKRFCGLVNLIGYVPDSHAVLAVDEAHLHLYGKTPKPGRKLGHVTVQADRQPDLERLLRRVQKKCQPLK